MTPLGAEHFRRTAVLGSAVFGLLFGVPGATAATVICVNPSDPSCASTIQAGLDSAAPGDTVQVSPGLYLEALTLDTAGVTLRGRGAVVDPEGLPGPVDAITVNADDVVIEGIAIRNGDRVGIRVKGAANARLVSVDVRSPESSCVDVQGPASNLQIIRGRFLSCGFAAVGGTDADGLRVADSVLESAQNAIRVQGDHGVFERNTLRRFGANGVSVVGDDTLIQDNRMEQTASPVFVRGDAATVRRNEIRGVQFGDAIDVQGEDATVTDNSVLGGGGLRAAGSAPVVQRNRLSATQGEALGVFCQSSCERGRVAANEVSGAGATGLFIESETPGLSVTANRLRSIGYAAMNTDTVEARIEGNRITGAGDQSGLACWILGGSGNQVIGNRISGCAGDGISVEGNANRIEANRIVRTGDDGIDLSSGGDGNQLLVNRVSDASDNGIEVSVGADGNLVSGNRASGIRAGYCDGGAGTTGSDVPDSTSGCGSIDD